MAPGPSKRRSADLEDVAAAEEQRALEDVAQLAHVAGPGVAAEGALGLGSEPQAAPAEVAREALQDLAREDRDVLGPLAQRAAPGGGSC